MSLLQEEPEELAETTAPRVVDCISLAVGGQHYVQNHRVALQLRQSGGERSARLQVSRYYWDLEPPVAVDFVRDLRYGKDEALAKKLHFKQQRVRYIVVRDAFDGEGAEAALTQFISDQTAPQPRGNRPLTGPRRQQPSARQEHR